MSDFEKILAKLPEITHEVNRFINLMINFRENCSKTLPNNNSKILNVGIEVNLENLIKQDLKIAEEFNKIKSYKRNNEFSFIQFDWQFEEEFSAVFSYQDRNYYYLTLYSNKIFGKENSLYKFIYTDNLNEFKEMMITLQCKIAHEFFHLYQTIISPERWEVLDTTILTKDEDYYSHPIELEAYSYEFANEIILKNKISIFDSIIENPFKFYREFSTLDKYLNISSENSNTTLTKFLEMTREVINYYFSIKFC